MRGWQVGLIQLLLLFCIDVYSQVITGKVYDNATGAPIANVTVYLNGTSYFTTTNDSGAFYLKISQIINTQLIISHVAYKTVVIDNPFEKESREIFLIRKNYELNEVVIKPGRFSYKELWKAFEQQFLGDNAAGKSCKIQNKKDIELYYDKDDNTLHATSEQPVVVENKYLGYQIRCSLIDFSVRYRELSLNAKSIETVRLLCNIFFTDLTHNDRVIKKRKDDIYKESVNYFFKSLTTKTFQSSKHRIYNIGNPYPADPYRYFDIIDGGVQKIIRIKPDTDISKDAGESVSNYFPYPVSGIIIVVDSAGHRSAIYFLTKEFAVDSYGNIDASKHNVFIWGRMGALRIGSMLPLNYELNAK